MSHTKQGNITVTVSHEWIIKMSFIAKIWSSICKRNNCDVQVKDIGILEAQRRWPRCKISYMHGNLYIAFRNNEIVGTTYYESKLALENKALAITGGRYKRESPILDPGSLGSPTSAFIRDWRYSSKPFNRLFPLKGVKNRWFSILTPEISNELFL